MTDVFSPQGVDYYEVFLGSGAPSEDVGMLLWRDLQPRPTLLDWSVTPTGTGRYNLFGSVVSDAGADACALAVASGRCMFTCGPGSLRCEGGTGELPKGEFALFNLPTEVDGSIIVQVFQAGSVSLTSYLDPSLFGSTPLPPPGNEPLSYSAFGGDEYTHLSGCFNLSADATQLVTTQSECDGGAALAFEAQIDAHSEDNNQGCDASIRISLSQAIPIVNQGFSVTTEDGARVHAYFRESEIFVDGSVQDANGCRAQWIAFREGFHP